jgi:hypothetical protein
VFGAVVSVCSPEHDVRNVTDSLATLTKTLSPSLCESTPLDMSGATGTSTSTVNYVSF